MFCLICLFYFDLLNFSGIKVQHSIDYQCTIVLYYCKITNKYTNEHESKCLHTICQLSRHHRKLMRLLEILKSIFASHIYLHMVKDTISVMWWRECPD